MGGTRIGRTARRVVGVGLFAACGVALSAQPAHTGEPLPTFTAPVVDTAEVIPASVEAELNADLKDYLERSGNQIAVAVIDTTGNRSIEEYSRELANTWGVGLAGVDNGVLVLIAYDDHELRIEVGRGLESTLSDGEAARIIEDDMTPYLRDDDPGGAIVAGTVAVRATLGDETAVVPDPPPGDFDPSPGFGPSVQTTDSGNSGFPAALGFIVVVGIIAVIGVAALFGSAGSRRRSWSSPMMFGSNQQGLWDQHHHRHDDDSHRGGFWSNVLSGSSSGGGSSFGGSSFGGGSDSGSSSGGGGGSFDGGGASGKW